MIRPLTLLACIGLAALTAGEAWTRHVIDASSRGADGVRLADVDGDGRLDVVTAWEEGGVVRVAFQPTADAVRQPWPSIAVGSVPSGEDAVAADLDGDAALDVVSASEQGGIHVHWGPGKGRQRDARGWTTALLPASKQSAAWMFIQPSVVAGSGRLDLVAGQKGEGANLGWFASPADQRRLEAWTWHPLTQVGWTMSLLSHDLDGDGHHDIIYSDQRGPQRGVHWLRHPGAGGDPRQPWERKPLGLIGLDNPDGEPATICFVSIADLDGDGLDDLLVGADRHIAILRRSDRGQVAFTPHLIPLPPRMSGAKSVRATDLDGDGRLELVASTLTAKRDQPVGLFTVSGDLLRGPWRFTDVGGPDGTKFDLVEPIDLSGDSQPDIITCEERSNLGVVWFENPGTRAPAPARRR